MTWAPVWAGLLAAAVCCAVVALVLPVLRSRAIDLPTHRSSHLIPTPRGGGVGVVVGLTVACLASAVAGYPPNWWVVLAAVTLGSLGLAEDLHGVSIGARLLAQVLVCMGAAAGLVLDARGAGWVVVSALAWVVVVNTFNFMDGINGISSLSTLVAAGWYAHLAAVQDTTALTLTALALAGAAVGFLPWNLPRARVFLGDCGSYALGGAVGALAIAVWVVGASVASTIAPLLIYLCDVLWTLARRMHRREAWRQAHREHAYQRLADLLGHGWTSVVVAGLSAVLCLIALTLDGEPVGWLVAAYAAVVGGYLGAVGIVHRRIGRAPR